MFNLLPIVVNAQSTGLVDGLQTLANTVLDLSRQLIMPVCAVLMIFLGLTVISATDPQSVASAKKWGLRIFIGFLIVMFAPTLLDTLKAFTSNVGFNW